jgi:hypothetical protein
VALGPRQNHLSAHEKAGAALPAVHWSGLWHRVYVTALAFAHKRCPSASIGQAGIANLVVVGCFDALGSFDLFEIFQADPEFLRILKKARWPGTLQVLRLWHSICGLGVSELELVGRQRRCTHQAFMARATTVGLSSALPFLY